MAFWKIAMRPGKPMMHGRLGTMGVIGLPGNPVSSYVCAFLFMVPLIRALSGRSVIHHRRERAVLGRDVGANDLREDYLRAHLEERDDGTRVALPVNHQDSRCLRISLQHKYFSCAHRSRRRPKPARLAKCCGSPSERPGDARSANFALFTVN